VFGQHERKAIAMALLDSSLMAGSTPVDGRDPAPAQDQEMVLSHIDGIESFGFLEHLKLPHYVTFGSALQGALEARAESALRTAGSPDEPAQVGGSPEDQIHEPVSVGQASTGHEHSHGDEAEHEHTHAHGDVVHHGHVHDDD